MKTTGKSALIELLRAHDVDYVFGIPGATEIHFMDALEKCPDIRYMLGLHEVVCVGMAAGYARASGKPGVLNLHTASGLAGGGALLYNAQLGKVPLVVTVGQNDSRLLQRDPQLTGDIVGLGKIHGKWSTELTRTEDLPIVIDRAFKMATQPPTGPVVVSLPQDLLQGEFDYTADPRVTHCAPSRPDSAEIERAAEALAAARHPLVMVESGVTRSGALEEVVRFAESIGAPVYQAWMADVNFPVAHPQYLGDLDPTSPQAAEIMAEVDVLVGIGCSLFAEGFTHTCCPLPRTTRVIHVDDDPWEIGKNLPTEFGLLGDVRATLRELNASLEACLTSEARERAARRAANVQAQKAAADAAWRTQTEARRDAVPISIGRLMTEISNVVDDDTVVVDECWSASRALRAALSPSRPLSYIRSRNGGSIGEGLPSALGVKLGRPDKDVLAVIGDGSASWSMQTLWTAARYQIPVTYVITNNATYGQVKLVRQAVLGVQGPLKEKHDGMDLDQPVIDFSALARSMGVEGTRISDPELLGDALRSAMGSGSPRLIEVMV